MDEFLLEEYRSLRAEIATRQAKAFRIITQGLFGIPAIVALGKLFEEQFDIGETLFLMAPAVIIVSCFVYVSEHNGMMRAGIYIRNNIEPHFLEAGQGWENWLVDNEKSKSRKVDTYLNGCFFVVVCLYFIGSMMAFWQFSDPLFGNVQWNLFILIVYPILGFSMIFAAAFEAAHGHRIWYRNGTPKDETPRP